MSTPTTPSRTLPWVVSGVALLAVAAVAVALAVWFVRPVQDSCATSEPIADGGSVTVDMSVGTKAGLNYLSIIDVNGRWYSAPDREVGGQTGALTELPAGEYTATVSRTGPRLTVSIEGQTLPLRDDGRCLD